MWGGGDGRGGEGGGEGGGEEGGGGGGEGGSAPRHRMIGRPAGTLIPRKPKKQDSSV